MASTARALASSSLGNAFIFGTSSASWQYEGSLHKDGRGPTIWDDFCAHKIRLVNIVQKEEGRIESMRSVQSYKISARYCSHEVAGNDSLSTLVGRAFAHWDWKSEPRALRTIAALQMLRDTHVEPFVTLFHFDLPSEIESRGGGLMHRLRRLSRRTPTFASAHGDLVKHWITINEPHTIATAGYGTYEASAAPGRCSNRTLCYQGNSSSEPYLVLILC